MRRRSFLQFAIVTSLLAQAACSSDNSKSNGSLSKKAGDEQTAAAGTPVQIAPSVLVVDANQQPVANVPVTFVVTSGGGLLASPRQTTNASGIATVGNWILGPTLGTNMLSASMDTGSVAAVVFVAHGSAVPTDAHLTGIATGDATACGLNIAAAVYCWGTAAGTDSRQFIATLVQPGATFSSVTAGDQGACMLSTGGVAYCWGANGSGQVGDGTTTDRTAPARVAGSTVFSALSSGGAHTCGLSTAGAAYCWGSVAGASSSPANTTPTAVLGGLSFSAIAASDTHICALTNAGAAWCWGSNGNGELGDGTATDRTAPVAVSGGLTFTRIASGSGYSCGLTGAGAAYCWGKNQFGQLGDGTSTDRAVPTAVSGGLVFSSLSAGAAAQRTCGVTTINTAYCWGQNTNGELGDGTQVARFAPTAVSGGFTFQAIATGKNRTCGTSTIGLSYCWGLSPLGDGTTAASAVPAGVKAQ